MTQLQQGWSISVKATTSSQAAGPGGHLYPAQAIAERIRKDQPDAKITFFCSERPIDKRVLDPSGFEYVCLPAKGFSPRPGRAIKFLAAAIKSLSLVKTIVGPVIRDNGRAVIIGCGGFVSVAAVLAGRQLKVPVAMLNVDIVPGRANKMLGRFAEAIFVQFADTVECFGKNKDRVVVSGCPLRADFGESDGSVVKSQLQLDPDKKILLITGASSGAVTVNNAIAAVLGELGEFADSWQMVHLTGLTNFDRVRELYADSAVKYKLLDYWDDMAGLYAAADLVVARAGAVTVAEIVACGAPAVFLPYPYHKDRHQYLNAGKVVQAGGGVIVDDLPAQPKLTAENLGQQLRSIMADQQKLMEMAAATKSIADLSAVQTIADRLKQI